MPKKKGNLRKKYCRIEAILAISETLHKDSGKWNQYLRRQWEEFDSDYCNNINRLYLELKSMTYVHSPYYIFRKLERGKERIIYSSSPRDRIVDHLLSQILSDTFEPLMEKSVYGSIEKRGQHKCRAIVKRRIRTYSHPYAATSDIRKYYPTCNVHILMNHIKRKIKCSWLQWLAWEFLKDGELILGNVSSNILGHINMLHIDRAMIRDYKFKDYYRFCDDMVILSDDKNYLHTGIREYRRMVEENGQSLKKDWAVFPIKKRRLDFLGLTINTKDAKIRKKSRIRIESELKDFCKNGISPEMAMRYWAGVTGGFKDAEISNLLKHWENEYPEFFARLRERKAASVAAHEQKRRHRKMEAELQSARDCRTDDNRRRYPIDEHRVGV